LEIDARVLRAIFENLDGSNIAFVVGDDAGQPVQDAQAGPCVHHKTDDFSRHQGASTDIIFSRVRILVGPLITISAGPVFRSSVCAAAFQNILPVETSWVITISVG